MQCALSVQYLNGALCCVQFAAAWQQCLCIYHKLPEASRIRTALHNVDTLHIAELHCKMYIVTVLHNVDTLYIAELHCTMYIVTALHNVDSLYIRALQVQ